MLLKINMFVTGSQQWSRWAVHGSGVRLWTLQDISNLAAYIMCACACVYAYIMCQIIVYRNEIHCIIIIIHITVY